MSSNLFNLAFSKFVGRADVYRDNEQDMNSAFSKVSVHVDKTGNSAGIMVLRDSAIQGVEMTRPTDIVLFNITALNYGKNETQGANILSKIVRYFETRDVLYVGAQRIVNEDKSESIAVTNVMRNKRENSMTVWYNTSVGYGEKPLTQEDKDCFALLIERFVTRAESNKVPQDMRKELWDGGVTTFYGAFKAQQTAQRKAK